MKEAGLKDSKLFRHRVGGGGRRRSKPPSRFHPYERGDNPRLSHLMSDSSEEEAEFTGEDVEPQQEDTNGPKPKLGKRRSSSEIINYKDEDEDAVDDEEMEDVQGSNDDEDIDDEDDDSDDSDDDDIPLAQLVKKKKQATDGTKKNGTKKSNGSATKKRKKDETKRSTPKKKAASTATTTSNTNKSYEYASAALYGTECDKGLLIQRLLCRWWYAYQWPMDIEETAPPGYDALEGFPGVYVCTGTGHAEVGKILDRRDLDRAPTFRNFATKPADELRDLLVKALTEQMKQLDEDDTITRKQLASMLKWARAMNTSKADKDATKILKAHSLFEAS